MQLDEPLLLPMLDALLLKAPVGLAFLDRELRYVRVNEELAAANGLPVQAHLGRTLSQVLPEVAEEVEPVLRRVLATGEPVVNRLVEMGEDPREPGRLRSWQVSYYPVPGPDGGPPSGVGLVVADVTDQRRAERARADAAQRLALLSRASALVGGSLDPRQMLAGLAAVTVPDFADHCYLELADPDAGEGVVLRRLATAYAPGAEPPGGRDIHPPGTVVHYPATHPVQAALHSGRAVLASIDDLMLAGAPSAEAAAHARRVGMASVIAAPLLAGGTVVGVASFVTSVSGRRYDEDDRAMAEELASRAAAAVANARAYEREQVARRDAEAAEGRLRLLADASVALGGSLRRQEVLDVAVGLLVPSVADWCAVHLLGEGGTPKLAAVQHRDPGRERTVRAFLDEFPAASHVPGVGPAIATGRAQLLPTLSEETVQAATADPALLQRLRDLRLVSGLAAPLTARGRTFGALSLLREQGAPYSQADLALAEELAGRVALALDNARLYAAQRDVAVALQRSLLPQTPQPGPGLAVAARYLPGAAGADVGGDWYDVIRLPGGCTGLTIGDVMGRGVRAAAVMGQLRAALRGYALEGHGPAEVLRRLARVVGAFDELNFTTCSYGVYDPARRTLTLATAGHLPPLLAEPGTAPRYVELDPALPLGVGDEAGTDVHTEQVIPLAPGSMLLLYTDGLVEASDTPLDVGMHALREALATPSGSPDEACERALGALDEHGHHHDDTALLAVLTAPEDVGEASVAAVELAPSPRSARAARDFVQRTLLGWRLDALEPTAVLLTSELVTNAVRHAASTVEVQLVAGARTLTVSVRDASPDLPAVHLPEEGREHGRGLVLIEQLADRWGAERHANGKRVWFELHLDTPPGGSGVPGARA